VLFLYPPLSDLEVFTFPTVFTNINTVFSNGREFGAIFSVTQVIENIAAAILEFQAYFTSKRHEIAKKKGFARQLNSVKCNFINQCRRGQHFYFNLAAMYQNTRRHIPPLPQEKKCTI
jgi:hypothetical protein